MTVAPPIPPQPQAQSASSQAITALVLGILGVTCCGIAAPIAWYIGNQELQSIQAGTSPAAGEGLAKAGKIMGMIGTGLMVLWLLWIFFMGGMAILQGAMNR